MITTSNLFSTFEGKRVLVCGASGMTGYNLYDYMKLLCADVIGTYHSHSVDYADSRPMFFKVDFDSKKDTEDFFNEFEFDYVFICCAKTYNVFMCESNPESMVLSNINMVGNILSNCLRKKVSKVVYISSSTVYQPSSAILSETDLDLNINPYDIYMGVGWMKRYAEKLCEFYSNLGLSISVARPTNIYGRYDKTDLSCCHVVPALIMRSLEKEDPFTVYGTGNPVKNLINVSDLVKDLATIATSKNRFSVYNLCSDEYVSISSLVNMINFETGHFPREIRFTNTSDGIPERRLSRDKFDMEFGKQIYIPLRKGIEDTVQWYSLLRQTVKK
jgi:GDP-L-fucose synthase